MMEPKLIISIISKDHSFPSNYMGTFSLLGKYDLLAVTSGLNLVEAQELRERSMGKANEWARRGHSQNTHLTCTQQACSSRPELTACPCSL